jgi:hypothetical protein
MLQRNSINFLASFLLIVMAVAAPVFAKSSFSVSLPNGFYIERDKSSQLGILNRHGKVAVSPIAGYSVYGSLVIGLAGKEIDMDGAYQNDRPLPESAESNYFVIDTKSGQIEIGLSASGLKTKLVELGVTATPEVRAPILPK